MRRRGSPVTSEETIQEDELFLHSVPLTSLFPTPPMNVYYSSVPITRPARPRTSSPAAARGPARRTPRPPRRRRGIGRPASLYRSSRQPALLGQGGGEDQDRVLLAVALELLLGAVLRRVAHGVALVAVGLDFHQAGQVLLRASATAAPTFSRTSSTSMPLTCRRGSRSRRAHSKVLHGASAQRTCPCRTGCSRGCRRWAASTEPAMFMALVQGALLDGAVAEEAQRTASAFLAVLLREGGPGRQRDVAARRCRCRRRSSARGSKRCIEPPLPLRAAGALAEQLGHHRVRGSMPQASAWPWSR